MRAVIAPLGPEERISNLARLRDETFDVVVVGGGVVGAGAAVDAASRGLTVALIDAGDWANGTSSRSSKLVHGGLRYLEHGDVALVREALRERSVLASHLAPHLVQPVPFLLPLRRRYWERIYIGAGLLIYDLMCGSRAWPRHRHLGRRRTMQKAPGLRADGLVGSLEFHDGQVDDARLTLALVRTAAVHGAVAVSYLAATRLVTDSEGRVGGVDALDRETGERVRVAGRTVIVATGVRAPELCATAGLDVGFGIRASKGVHLVVEGDRIDLHTALIVRTERSVLFVLPWGDRWLIGTTDTDYADNAEPVATEADISYLLDRVNPILQTPIRRADVVSTYAGLRPLIAARAADTASLSREHVVTRPAPGLAVIAGGKLTTYRVMARDAVDAAVRDLGATVPPSMTASLPLAGADGYAALVRRAGHLATRSGLAVSQVERLLHRYGATAIEVLDLVGDDPRLARPVPGSEPYLAAEMIYAVRAEGARHLDDVLVRRTRLSIEDARRALACAPAVADLIGPLLGWDEPTRAAEIRAFHQHVVAPDRADDVPREADRVGAAAEFASTSADCGDGPRSR